MAAAKKNREGQVEVILTEEPNYQVDDDPSHVFHRLGRKAFERGIAY